MQCSFTYSSTTYTYYVDNVAISARASGRQERLISGDMDQDFHDIEFLISIKGIWEQVGASTKSVNALWNDLLGGADVAFVSDTSDSTSFTVVPDLRHVPKFIDVASGTHRETVEIRLIAKSVYQETDSVATGLAGKRPHYG